MVRSYIRFFFLGLKNDDCSDIFLFISFVFNAVFNLILASKKFHITFENYLGHRSIHQDTETSSADEDGPVIYLFTLFFFIRTKFIRT